MKSILPILMFLLMSHESQAASDNMEIRLVVVIAVDQLSRERFSAKSPGGLGRLAREGQTFINAQLNHGVSTTCPGHAVILTGMDPVNTGITHNEYFDHKTHETRYCVYDPQTTIIGGTNNAEQGRSPRRLKVDTLGDWLQTKHPAAKVFSISAKDRAAIPLGGQHPDGAYWFDRDTAMFTTSSYYAEKLPRWLREFNGSDPTTNGYLSTLPQQWVHPTRGDRPDDYAAESAEFNRSSPHPLLQGDLEDIGQQIYVSPYVDQAVGELAKRIIVAEQLGKDHTPDLLALSFSANDTVGHLYGPHSSEAIDTLARLDQNMDELFSVIEHEVGLDHTLIVLTADHGVIPLPEWLEDTGQQGCSGHRTGVLRLATPMLWHVYWNFTGPFDAPWDLIGFGASGIHLNRNLIQQNNWQHEEIVSSLETLLEANPMIRKAWTREEIVNSNNIDGQLIAKSYDPELGADLTLQIEEGCVLGITEGTTHGTIYDYDRDIPLVFFGPDVTPLENPSAAHSVDIAPTLAELLAIPAPKNLDGRVLQLRR